jgi:hypothetical protein
MVEPGVGTGRSMMITDMNASSQIMTAPPDDDLGEVDLVALNPDPEQMSTIQQNAVRSALRSVTKLRLGLSPCDSPTFGDWTQASSAPESDADR